MEIEINICWNGSIRTLNETISNELSRVTGGEYKHGKVIHSAAGDYYCVDRCNPLYSYHRKLKVIVGELYG